MENPWAFGWTQVLTLAGFVITVGIAATGFRTFGRWKREKIEERRIEVALDALALAYEAKFQFERIRSRRVRESEWERIDEREQNLPGGGTATILIKHREGQRAPYAVLKRIGDSEEYFERVSKIEPKFMAIFGSKTTEIFSILFDTKLRVQTAAEALFEEYVIEHDPSDTEARDRMRKWRADIFASSGEVRPEDEVGQKVVEFQARIEALCRPIVDAEFGSARRKAK